MDQPTRNRVLSPLQLSVLLVVVTLLPFLLVVFLYTSMPDIRDPVLDVEVAVGPRAWPSNEAVDARVVACLVLSNPTTDAWNYLNLSINHQFHFTHPYEVGGGEEIVVPLKFFHTKGNAFFPPESQELKSLTIYAQIPSGARAIREFEGASLPGFASISAAARKGSGNDDTASTNAATKKPS